MVEASVGGPPRLEQKCGVDLQHASGFAAQLLQPGGDEG